MSETVRSVPEEASDTALLRQIAGAIRGIRYGSVEIVIHDSRVVQVERREKVRLTQDAESR
jgi:hypothetical protein